MSATSDKMPDVQQFQSTQGFGFSAVPIANLEADEYTLVNIAVDASGSISRFTGGIIATLKEIVKSCGKSPRADNMLIRVTTFGRRGEVSEVHGFVPLSQIVLNVYDGILDILGNTPLYEAIVDQARAVSMHARTLDQADYVSNGIGFVITDGQHYSPQGICSITDAGDANRTVLGNEALESWQSILIGVNVDPNSGDSTELARVKTECRFDSYIPTRDANENTLARLARFVSRSISSASQALGTGGPSKLLTF